MKKTNHRLILTILILISIASISIISVTYSKFIYEKNISNTINVPEYNHCIANGVNTLSDCIILNENDAKTKDIALATINSKTVDYTVTSTTDEGLLASTDDYGTTYYYRGSVNDNYVSYAGYIWRIVRINGDGSVRLIYAGTETLSAGEATSIGTIAYNNTAYTDMTYLGYKYGLNPTSKTSNTVVYNDLYADKVSVHANKISCDSATMNCTLSDNVITEKWSSGYLSVLHWTLTDIMSIFRKPKYTCWKSSTDAICNVYMEVTGRTDGQGSGVMPTEVNGKYTGYISSTYASTLTNENNSTIKDTLDTWYATNILNKTDESGISFANYVADNKFCNDRSLSSGDGNTLNADSVYGSYKRNTNQKQPSLNCTQTQDSFSTTTISGNGSLTYPIGLITADELAMSGVVAGTENSNSYLNTGISYWTMSPGYFSINKLTANNYVMTSTGTIDTQVIGTEAQIRPVINLSSSVKITRGNGTVSNPYQVTLN